MAGEPPVSTVRLTSGAVLLAAGPVERRGGLVVFRTVQGRLVSVSDDRVAEIVTPAAPPVLAEGGGVANTEDGKVYTNTDLPEGPSGYVPPPPGKIPESAVAIEAPLTYETYRDRDGRDESWWRQRAAGLDRNVKLAQDRVERETSRWHELDTLARASCPINRYGYFGGRCAAILGEAEEARRRMDDAIAAERVARDARSALDAEATRAGALPGWLR